MKNIIWDLFYETGNVDTYLLLKQLENEQLEEILSRNLNEKEVIASMHTKL